MAALVPDPGPSYPSHGLAPQNHFSSPHNHIDLTGDDDDDDGPDTMHNQHSDYFRMAKRPRMECYPSAPGLNGPPIPPSFRPHSAPMPTPGPSNTAAWQRSPGPPTPGPAVFSPENSMTPATYRPAFASSQAAFFPQRPTRPPLLQPSPFVQPPQAQLLNTTQSRQVIDLTSSPSPPPQQQPQRIPALSPDLPPKTPVCIGQLTVTALILYPVPYITPRDSNSDNEYASVRLQYEHNPQKPGCSDTIHIKTPTSRSANGDMVPGEQFGVVEQKVATSLGPMLGKGLIRLDAKIKKGKPGVCLCIFLSLWLEIEQILCLAPDTTASDARLYAKGEYTRSCKFFAAVRPALRPSLLGVQRRHPPYLPLF